MRNKGKGRETKGGKTSSLSMVLRRSWSLRSIRQFIAIIANDGSMYVPVAWKLDDKDRQLYLALM